jgi:hypothetical protein
LADGEDWKKVGASRDLTLNETEIHLGAALRSTFVTKLKWVFQICDYGILPDNITVVHTVQLLTEHMDEPRRLEAWSTYDVRLWSFWSPF